MVTRRRQGGIGLFILKFMLYIRSIRPCWFPCHLISGSTSALHTPSAFLMSSKRKRSDLACSAGDSLVVIISGCTGVGKSDVAAQLCQRLTGMVVSADSVQAYRGVQIGANKPTIAEREQTPHLLVDIVDDASQTYNAAEWRQDALFTMESLLLRNQTVTPSSTPRDKSIQAEINKARAAKGYTSNQPIVPVVVGGTMMYLQWLVHGRPDVCQPTDEAVQRAYTKIQEYQDQDDWESAVDHVASFGPTFVARLESLSGCDWYRLRRTLEIAYTSGDDARLMEKLYSGEREGSLESLGYDVRCFFLCPSDRMAHTTVVDRRCEEMVRRGLLKETTDLALADELPEMARRAIGYRQTLEYLQRQDPTENDAEAFGHFLNEFTTATRRYAKKQMQWFRKEDKFLFVPVTLSESKTDRVSASTDMIEKLCLVPRETYEMALMPVMNDGEVPLSEKTKRANEGQGKGMKFYQLQRYLLSPGCPDFDRALVEADDCTRRMTAAKKSV